MKKDTIKLQLSKNEQGISILVVMIMMIVITILVIGFAQIAGHEQQDSLSSQLAYQAYYAAESGINDVASYLQTYPTLAADKTTCTNVGGDASPSWDDFYRNYQEALGNQSVGDNVKNTCILVNTTPASVVKQFTEVGSSWVVPLYTADYTDAQSITFSFTPPQGVTPNLVTCDAEFGDNNLPAADGDCGYGALRFDLVQVGTASPSAEPATTPDALLTDTMSALLVPQLGGSTPSYGFLTNNNTPTSTDTYAFGCSATSCSATINLPATANEYYLRVVPIYNTGTLTITGVDTTNAIISWRGAQVSVDSTGEAQYELKRLQATLPIDNGGFLGNLPTPDYGLQTTESICKDFAISPGQVPVSQDSANCPVE